MKTNYFFTVLLTTVSFVSASQVEQSQPQQIIEIARSNGEPLRVHVSGNTLTNIEAFCLEGDEVTTIIKEGNNFNIFASVRVLTNEWFFEEEKKIANPFTVACLKKAIVIYQETQSNCCSCS